MPHLFLNKDQQLFQCDVCQFAKHTKSVYSSIGYRPTSPFSVVHSDIWGPIKVSNVTGARWFITFIDDHTRMTWTFLMKEKSETKTLFQDFYALVQTQFQTQIRVLKTDNAKDYFNSILSSFFVQKGIIHVSSCVETPQQNGVAERKNRHLLEVARACMFAHHVPKYLWGEAVLTATYLINRMPSRVINFASPRQKLLTMYPQVAVFSSDLPPKVFGCTAFVHISAPHRTKLDPRSIKCVFTGYSSHQKGYKCYSPQTRKFYYTRDVTFFETQSFFPKNVLQEGCITTAAESTESQFWDLITALDTDVGTNVTPETASNDNSQGELQVRPPIVHVYQRRKEAESTRLPSTISEDQTAIVDPTTPTWDADLDIPIAIRKGVRSCTQHPIGRHVGYERLSENFKVFITSLDNTKVPKNIQEALQEPKWKQAVIDELQALEKNNTWDIVKLPPDKRTVDCKWIFTIKYNSDGTIERFKARLVARGFTQTQGLDYEETFAPVAKPNTIRVLLSLAANQDWPLHQLDVKNAFLNGDLLEEVYMNPPPGFQDQVKGKVCKLKKSLYGLKQSPRAWFDRFTKAVKSADYYQCQTDHTMFIKCTKSGKRAILIVYVDDIIITGDALDEIQKLKKYLATEFELKDLGELKYFLGMEVARSNQGILLSQRKYVLDLLKEAGMLGCKPSATPMEANKQMSREIDIPLVDKEGYQRLVGKLIYLGHTRPDISYSVGIVSQHMHNPNAEHMEMVLRILKYLKGAPGKGLLFRRSTQHDITVYTDASWAGELTDRRSTTGYCTYVWGNLVTWRSKKQDVVARSSAEAEYRAVALGIQEAIWLKRVLEELKVDIQVPIQLFCDS
ncbi:Retrovirus-related Pol polyprotein from transposon TNT 1-94 [Linum perenne]